MQRKVVQSDKEIIKRIMSEPTFEAVRQAAIRENEKHREAVRDALRNAKPEPRK